MALLIYLASGSGAAHAVQYPLKLSADGRHLEDQAGQPFLINGDTPWSLIVKLTKAEAATYLEDRRSRGFNAIIVEIIENKFGGPYNRDGEYPFMSAGDFSRPNELYFKHVDWVISKAADKGLLVILTPAYLGYKCGSEGWCAEVKAASLADLRSYGNFLGNRYKAYNNIIWMHGGDVAAGNFGAMTQVNAIADGIREVDPDKLFTAHCTRQSSAMDCYNQPWLDINNTYSGCDLSALKTRADYQRSPAMPFFYAEGRYEGEGTTDGRCIRSQAYWSVLGGSTGHFFGNNPVWLFDPGWEDAMNSPGSRNMTHFGNLFASRPWSLLVPDYAEKIVTGNRAAIGGKNYIMAARASDGSVIMAYLPRGGTVSVDMSGIAGSAAKTWWYAPENGTARYVGEFAPGGTQSFTAPDTSDWVLVVDNADLGFPPPGETAPASSSQCTGATAADPGCSNSQDDDKANGSSNDAGPDKGSQTSATQSGISSLEHFTLLLLSGVLVALRRRPAVFQ